MQVSDRVLPGSCAQALQHLARLHDGERLSDRQLAIAVLLAKALADLQRQKRARHRAFLPDVGGVMAPSSALYVNDAVWLVGRDTRLVHPDVPMDVARELNARSLRQHHQVIFKTLFAIKIRLSGKVMQA